MQGPQWTSHSRSHHGLQTLGAIKFAQNMSRHSWACGSRLCPGVHSPVFLVLLAAGGRVWRPGFPRPPPPPPWSRCSFPVAAVASYPIPVESSLTGTKIKVWAGFSPSGRYRGVGSLPLPSSGGHGQPLAGGHITLICLCGRSNSSYHVRCSPCPSRTNTCDGILCSPRMQGHLPISWSFLTLSQLGGPFCHVRSQVPLDPD